MNYPRLFLIIVTGCLLAGRVHAQSRDIIPDSGQQQLRALPEEARDTVYRRWGNYFYSRYTQEGLVSALDCYTAAVRIATKYNHEDVVRLCQYNIGTVYDAMNDYKKATEYYELFYQRQVQMGDAKLIFRSAYNLATVASKAGDKPQVRKYAHIMEQYLTAITDRDYRVKGNLLLANLAGHTDDTTSFLYHYHLLPEDAAFKDGELAFGRLYAETESDYLLFKGDSTASLEPLYAALVNTTDSVPLLTLIVNREEQIGLYKDALGTRKKLDKILNGRTTTTLRNDIEKRLLGIDNELMERKNQLLLLQQTHLLQQRRQLYGIMAVLLVGFLVAICYYFWLKSKNAQIGVQNEQIKRQNDNIGTLLREVHHRVKNNLQLINSVVELQQLRADVNPADSLREMQLKMQSIALAHELLYGQDDLEYVPLQEYFSRLALIIMRIYPLQQQNISSTINMNGLQLPLDKSLSLALAVNELLINSLKHVYPVVALCKIDLSCHAENGFYIFTYSDNGPGLPEGIKPQSSVNIGLRLVHNLVKQLGGRVDIDSSSGYLLFTFTFKP